MPTQQANVDVSGSVERDFLDALARIEKGKPNHPKLRKLAARGKLRIGISSVALEAGRSRTLIGTIDCAYPGVRNRILGPERSSAQCTTQDEVIAKLRSGNEDLRNENAQLATQLADAVAVAWRLKEKLDFEKAIRKTPRGASGNVVDFERRDLPPA